MSSLTTHQCLEHITERCRLTMLIGLNATQLNVLTIVQTLTSSTLYQFTLTLYYPAHDSSGNEVLFSIDFFVSLFLSLFLCQQDYEKTAGPICMKFSGKVWSDHGTT